jgi:methylglyoxal synthase
MVTGRALFLLFFSHIERQLQKHSNPLRMTRKRVALIAHDHKKDDMVRWAQDNKEKLATCELYGTSTTGTLVEKALDLPVIKLKSGPFGGDQQIGALIAEGKIDILIFFWDPLHPLPHDQDIKALLRVAVLWNIPLACNRSTADFIFTSSFFAAKYERELPEG